MLISLVSMRHSPGVSTLALALGNTWKQRSCIVADCDPMGSEVLDRLDPTRTRPRRGVLDALHNSRKLGLDQAIHRNLLPLAESTRRFALPGVFSMRESASVQWSALASAFSSWSQTDVIADCGRLHTVGMPQAVIAASHLKVLVLDSTPTSALAVHNSISTLRSETMVAEHADDLVAVVVGPGRPYPTKDISRFLHSVGVPVIGEIAWDPAASAVLSGQEPEGRKFRQSALLKSAETVGVELSSRARVVWNRLQTVQPVARQAVPSSSAGAPRGQEPLVQMLTAQTLPPVPQPDTAAWPTTDDRGK